MQVSRSQAARAWEAVRHGHRQRRSSARRRQAARRPAVSLRSGASPLTIEQALRRIDEQPPIRIHLVEAATARLAAGDRPPADVVAEMAIRRATCDLLR